MEFPQKLQLLYDPAIPPLGIYLKKKKTQIKKIYRYPKFTVSLFTITKIGKQPKYPLIDEWIEKMRPQIRMKSCRLQQPWMDLKGIYYAK